MEWDEYMQICDRPDVLSRWLLQQTAAVCDESTAQCLLSITESPPIEKPSDHKGGFQLDMFRTEFQPSDLETIKHQVLMAIARGTMTTDVVVRDYSGILKAWEELERWVSKA